MKNALFGLTKRYALLLLSILAAAGVMLLIGLFQMHSEPGNQLLFGISLRRLGIGLIFSFFLAINIMAIIWIGLGISKRKGIENKILAWMPWITILFYLVAMVAGTLLLAMLPPIIRAFKALRSVSDQLNGLFLWLFILGIFLIVLIKATYGELLYEKRAVQVAEHFLLVSGLFVVIFFVYEHLLIWMGAANQVRYSYWNLLADEFLKGTLYLENPPTLHDLTLYQGHWYVPMPPLPAILMMPQAYLFGGKNISTSNFSIVFSAINAILVYLMLEQLVERKWVTLSRTGMVILVILFAFGTPHLWVGIRGRAWFISQTLTVTFIALAILMALHAWSPWWVGISFGLAMISRPNAIMSWPLALAVALQILKEESGRVDWKKILNWSIKSVLPMGLAIAGLLYYNLARFGNFFDFGYAGISGDEGIVANVKNYGMFSPHFIATNLRAMLLELPIIQPGAPWPIMPSAAGMNVFLVTPPLLYLFHRYELKWWILGAWAAVICNLGLLLMYSSTGAHQFGYRYLLDFLVPLIALLATALNGKIRWHFILLLLFSIAFNIYGANWFING